MRSRPGAREWWQPLARRIQYTVARHKCCARGRSLLNNLAQLSNRLPYRTHLPLYARRAEHRVMRCLERKFLQNWKVNIVWCSDSVQAPWVADVAAPTSIDQTHVCQSLICVQGDNVMWQRYVPLCRWNSLWKCSEFEWARQLPVAGAPWQCWIAPTWNASYTTTITMHTCITSITCRMPKTQVSLIYPHRRRWSRFRFAKLSLRTMKLKRLSQWNCLFKSERWVLTITNETSASSRPREESLI